MKPLLQYLWADRAAPVERVCQDDQSIQAIVEEALSDGGFDPAIASTGEEALTALRGTGGKYRLLVLDIKLGTDGIKGWDVARRARAINPALPAPTSERPAITAAPPNSQRQPRNRFSEGARPRREDADRSEISTRGNPARSSERRARCAGKLSRNSVHRRGPRRRSLGLGGHAEEQIAER